MLNKDDKILRYFGIGSIAIVVLYVVISVTMLVAGISEANQYGREYEINFVREMETYGDFDLSTGGAIQLKRYSSFIKIYYTEEDVNNIIESRDQGIGGAVNTSGIGEYYYPDLKIWSGIFELLFVVWMLHGVLTSVYIFGKRMFKHTVFIQVALASIWLVAGEMVLLSLRGFVLFLPLLILNIYVIKFTRFKDINEHWFKSIAHYEIPKTLY